MKIKVCGMREPENIRAVSALGIDMMGFIFWEKSPRCVSQLPADMPTECQRVGVFVDEMPQTVVTKVHDFRLDYVQLHGTETAVYIDNLRNTLVPDIAPDIKIIKALSIREADDVKRWREYEGCADLLLFDTKCKTVGGSGEKFDWSVLDAYDGDIPFILSGGIGPDDAERVKAFKHPRCVGIDLNSRFEVAPALKDTDKLSTFIKELK